MAKKKANKNIKKPKTKIVYRDIPAPTPDYFPWAMLATFFIVMSLVFGLTLARNVDSMNGGNALGEELCKARLGEGSGYLKITRNGYSDMKLICITGKTVIEFDPAKIAEQEKEAYFMKLVCEAKCEGLETYDLCMNKCIGSFGGK